MTPRLTPARIAALIRRRDKLTNRRDGWIDVKAVNRIDAQLSQVPPGQDNEVDKRLGRGCAVLPERDDYGPQAAPQDYRIANRPGNPNWNGVAAWFDGAAQQAVPDDYLKGIADQYEDYQDWLGIRGDTTL